MKKSKVVLIATVTKEGELSYIRQERRRIINFLTNRFNSNINKQKYYGQN